MCEYCDDNFEFWQAEIRGNLPNVKFCPNCGRPLEEPKPLTLEQLMEREGKPVWVKFDKQSEWCLIAHILAEGFIGFYNSNGSYKLREFKDYNITWQAFAHEPKQSEKILTEDEFIAATK